MKKTSYSKKNYSVILIITLFNTVISFSQVGMGTHTPDPSTVLEIKATDKGVLLPRIALTDVTSTSLDGTNTAATGLLIYNTNALVTGGDGVGFYTFNGSSWNKIITSETTIDDHDWYVKNTTDIPTNINDDIYTYGNVGIGEDNPTSSLHILTLDSNANAGVRVDFSGSDNNLKIGFWSRLSQTGNGDHYGVKNEVFAGDGIHYGTYNGMGSNGNGKQYGTYNFLDNSSGTSYHYGTYNKLQSSGNGLKYGNFNELIISGSGKQYANYNYFWNLGTGDQYGLYNDWNFTQNINRKRYGVYNVFNIQGTGTQYGSYSVFHSTGDGEIYGSYNWITNSGNTATHYGIKNNLSGGGGARTGDNYGIQQLLSDSGGTGTQYGIYNYISGTGTNNKYGTYNIITDNGGTHYGVYSDVQKAGSWAGYFVGDIYASSKIGIGIDAPTYALEVLNGAVMLGDMVAPIATIGYSGIYSSGGELNAIDESGNSTVISPHHFSLTSPSDKMAWSYYSRNENIGQEINVDMYKAIQLIENLSGEKLIYKATINGTPIETNQNVESLNDKVNDLIEENEKLKEQLIEQQLQLDKIKELLINLKDE